MDRQKIQNAIRLLDGEVPRENARVRFEQYGGGPDEGHVIANETGYLRLGIELLKAAFARSGAEGQSSTRIDVDIEYLVVPDSSINFDWFERTEVADVTSSPSAASHSASIVVFVLITLCAILTVTGLVTVVRWIVD